MATIPVGSLPHGIWPSGDGSRVYVALENGGAVLAIETASEHGDCQHSHWPDCASAGLCAQRGAGRCGDGESVPLGEAANSTKFDLVSASQDLPKARASATVNSLGALDLVEVAVANLTPKSQYKLCVAESNQAPFGKVECLAVIKTNVEGSGIAQAIGPLKAVANTQQAAGAPQASRYLVVTDQNDTSKIVLKPGSANQNGCMRVIFGSHKRGQLDHQELRQQNNLLRRGEQIAVEVDESEAVDLELCPGEMSLHHCNIIHGSNPNRSDEKRIGFIVRFVTNRIDRKDRKDRPLVKVRGSADCGHLELTGEPDDTDQAKAFAQWTEFTRRRQPS